MSEKDGKGSKADPELLTMGRMARTLDALDHDARQRVLAWLNDKYADRWDAATPGVDPEF